MVASEPTSTRIAAFDELMKNQPDLFGSWAKREGFF